MSYRQTKNYENLQKRIFDGEPVGGVVAVSSDGAATAGNGFVLWQGAGGMWRQYRGDSTIPQEI